jgi:hypothetical protein
MKCTPWCCQREQRQLASSATTVDILPLVCLEAMQLAPRTLHGYYTADETNGLLLVLIRWPEQLGNGQCVAVEKLM